MISRPVDLFRKDKILLSMVSILIAYEGGKFLLRFIDLNPLFGIVIIGFAIFALIVFIHPFTALLLIFALTIVVEDVPNDLLLIQEGVFNPLYHYHIPILHFAPIELLFLCIILTIILKPENEESVFVRTPLDSKLIAFLVACFFGILYSLFWGGPREPGYDVPYIVAIFKFRPIAYMCISYFLVVNLISTRERLNRLMLCIFGVLIYKGCEGIYRYFSEIGVPIYDISFAASRIFIGDESGFFVAPILLYLSFLLHVRSDIKRLSIASIGIIPIFFSFIFSFIRGVQLGLLVGMGYLFMRKFGLKKIIIACIAFTSIFILLVNISDFDPYGVTSILPKHYTYAEWKNTFSFEYRWYETKNALLTWLENPLLGVGFGGLWKDYHYIAVGMDQTSTHNFYLYVLLHAGLIGFIPFSWLIISFIRESLAINRTMEDKHLNAVVLGLLSSFIAVLVAFIFGPWLIFPRTSIWFGGLMAMVMAIKKIGDRIENKLAQ